MLLSYYTYFLIIELNPFCVDMVALFFMSGPFDDIGRIFVGSGFDVSTGLAFSFVMRDSSAFDIARDVSREVAKYLSNLVSSNIISFWAFFVFR